MKFSVVCLIAVSFAFAVSGCGSDERQEMPNAEPVRAPLDEVSSSESNAIYRLVAEIDARARTISQMAESAFSLCSTTSVEVASILLNTYPADALIRLNPPGADAVICANGACSVADDVNLPTPSSVLEVESMWDAARKCRQSADKMIDGLRGIRAETLKLMSDGNVGLATPDAKRLLSALTSQCMNVTKDAGKFNFLMVNELLKERGELAVRKAHQDVAKAKRRRELAEKKKQWKQIERDRMSFVPAGAEEIARMKQSFVEANSKKDIVGATKSLKELLPNILPHGVWYDKVERYPRGNWRVVVSEIGTKPYLPWTMIMFADGSLAKCDWNSLTQLAKIECVAVRQDDEYNGVFRLVEEFMPVGTRFTDTGQIPGYEKHPMSDAQLSMLKVKGAKQASETRAYYNADGGQVTRVSVTLNADGTVNEISGESIAHGIGNAVYRR